MKCPFCGNEITIDFTKVPNNIKSFIKVCEKCGNEVFKLANPNYIESNQTNLTLDEIIMKEVNSDPFWLTKINEFLDLLDISYDDKVQFIINLAKNQNKFNEFTGELTKSYDAFSIYEIYK